MGTNFLGIPHSMGFTMLWEIWGENPCISHVMKYTIGWESNGKKHPYCGKCMSTRFSPYDGFCCIFLYYGKLVWKPMHFPFDEACYRMGIVLGKIIHTMGKVWVPISQVHSIRCVLSRFPVLWEIYWENHAFLIWWHWLIFSCVFVNIGSFRHTLLCRFLVQMCWSSQKYYDSIYCLRLIISPGWLDW